MMGRLVVAVWASLAVAAAAAGQLPRGSLNGAVHVLIQGSTSTLLRCYRSLKGVHLPLHSNATSRLRPTHQCGPRAAHPVRDSPAS
jgi:hypothetical protein